MYPAIDHLFHSIINVEMKWKEWGMLLWLYVKYG